MAGNVEWDSYFTGTRHSLPVRSAPDYRVQVPDGSELRAQLEAATSAAKAATADGGDWLLAALAGFGAEAGEAARAARRARHSLPAAAHDWKRLQAALDFIASQRWRRSLEVD